MNSPPDEWDGGWLHDVHKELGCADIAADLVGGADRVVAEVLGQSHTDTQGDVAILGVFHLVAVRGTDVAPILEPVNLI